MAQRGEITSCSKGAENYRRFYMKEKVKQLKECREAFDIALGIGNSFLIKLVEKRLVKLEKLYSGQE